MGAFLFGLIVGLAGTLALFIYDEGEVFLKLGNQVKRTAAKYNLNSGDWYGVTRANTVSERAANP